jgi:hypothetical protein
MTQPSQAPGAPIDAGGTGLAPDPSPQQGTDPADSQGGQTPASDPQDISSLPEWAQKAIAKTRDEAAGYRTKYKSAEQQAQEAAALRDKMLSVMGLNPDGAEEQTPEKLSAQLEQFQADLWERNVENTVLRSASKLGADADALLDSNKFLDSLADLDDGADLEAHIASFVASNPKFKAQSGPARNAADFNGGNGAGRITREQLASMAPADIAKAQREGRLSHLM